MESNEKYIRYGTAILFFVLGLVGALILKGNSQPWISGLSVLGGIALATLLLISVIGGKGSVRVQKDGMSVEWDVRKLEPIDTLVPSRTTDSSESGDAKRLCQEGRDLLASHAGGGSINLEEAYSLFERAAEIDPKYWEPKMNMAGILILRGELEKAFTMASEIRMQHHDNVLAFADASLIMASAIETSIDSNSHQQVRSKYEKIIEILDEALAKAPEDDVVRSALIKSLILGGGERDRVGDYVRGGLKNAGFRGEFSAALEADNDLKREFASAYPELAAELFPTR